MSTRRHVTQSLSLEDENSITVPLTDDILTERQEDLDATLHELHDLKAEYHQSSGDLDDLCNLRISLILSQLELKDNCKDGVISEETFVSQERFFVSLEDAGLADENAYPTHDDYMRNAATASQGVFKAAAAKIAAVETKIVQLAHSVSTAITNFMHGHEKVCEKALAVLGDADRILDKPSQQPRAKDVALKGAIAKSLQEGNSTIDYSQAVDHVISTGNETVERFMPQCVDYAHRMAQAFRQSDLTKIRHQLGLDKKNFMIMAAPFADVKPPIPSYCTIHGEHHYMFGMKSDYREELSSKPLPGNKAIILTHPVGDLRTLVDREDAKGFYSLFPAWLHVSISVENVPSNLKGQDVSLPVPAVSELKSHLAKCRNLVKEIRGLSLKSEDYVSASNAALQGFESYVTKQFDTPANFAAHILPLVAEIASHAIYVPQGLALKGARAAWQVKDMAALGRHASKFAMWEAVDRSISAVFVIAVVGFGHLGYTSGKLLEDTIVEVGGYYAEELRNLATIGLKLAQQYK
jgi:hypothetical protein